VCGVCGIYTPGSGDAELSASAVERMTAALEHRGPDDQGLWTDAAGRVSLGNRRLAIIDLSADGHQPMIDSSGRIALTYNGMIYNYQELRRDLVASGYRFRGHSDTEVILALYRREKHRVCRRLRGMFAFALWDGDSRTLMLARDRLGIKPLYYTCANGRWMFASEIRALRASALVPFDVSPTALAAFLRLGSVPGPMTVLKGVHELPPATVLTIHDDGATELERYWDIPAPTSATLSDDDAAGELRARLVDAVRCHLISDVPVGVFLSGGTDSAIIASAMREAGHNRIRSFSLTFPGAELDEGPDAARVAVRYGTSHCAYEVRGSDVARDLDDVIAAMDQPTIDGLNTYYVSRVTRASGTVVALSGLGGDELFCGYPSFRRAPRVLVWQHVAAQLGPVRPAFASLLSRRSPKLREGLLEAPAMQTAYLAVRGLFGRADLSRLLAPGAIRDALHHLDAAAALTALAPPLPQDLVAATSLLELRGYMHNQLLRDTDVMSMAHGLEVRVPFLDHPVVELAAGLPGTVRANGHRPKRLLFQAFADTLPSAQPKKRGFSFPINEWLRGSLCGRIDDALGDAEHLFNTRAVETLRADVESGRTHWSRLWSLVVLALWLRVNNCAGSI
jgi:asparagine synthase (glutamine-hydrolysing)